VKTEIAWSTDKDTKGRQDTSLKSKRILFKKTPMKQPVRKWSNKA